MEVGHQKLVPHPPSSPQARKDGKIIRYELNMKADGLGHGTLLLCPAFSSSADLGSEFSD